MREKMILNTETKRFSSKKILKTPLSILALCVATTSFANASASGDESPLDINDAHSINGTATTAPTTPLLTADSSSIIVRFDSSPVVTGTFSTKPRRLFQTPRASEADASRVLVLSPAVQRNTSTLDGMGITPRSPMHPSFYQGKPSGELERRIQEIEGEFKAKKQDLVKTYNEVSDKNDGTLDLMYVLFEEPETLESLRETHHNLARRLKALQKPAETGTEAVGEYLSNLYDQYVDLLKQHIYLKVQLERANHAASINAATIQGLVQENAQLRSQTINAAASYASPSIAYQALPESDDISAIDDIEAGYGSVLRETDPLIGSPKTEKKASRWRTYLKYGLTFTVGIGVGAGALAIIASYK